MAYSDSPSFGFTLTPWVKRLLIANVAVFVLTLIPLGFVSQIVDYLAFVPADILSRPWTVITYMFVHSGFLHILFNMIALFFFGPPVEERFGSNEFIKYYIICGLGGAAGSFLFAFHNPVIGASAAIYGVMLAFAMNWPDSPIYIYGILPIKAKWLVVLYVAIDLFSAVRGGGGGIAHFAHLGGLVAGFLYIKLDDPMTLRLARLRKLMTRPRLTVIAGDQPANAKPTPRPARRHKEDALLDSVDRVLDKISASGMSSLTPEERKLLDEVSKRFRQN
jgi:membrane associated rhomboid family serine protease